MYKKAFTPTPMNIGVSLLRKRGFTLIELLVVISIISLLASVVLGALNGARVKARDTKRVQDLKQIQLALELYFDKEGAYPIATNYWGDPAETEVQYSFSSTPADWNNLSSDLAVYISSVPRDPVNNLSIAPLIFAADLGYTYWTPTDGLKYELTARFETDNLLDCSNRNYSAVFDHGFTFFPAGTPLCNPSNLNDNIYVISSE